MEPHDYDIDEDDVTLPTEPMRINMGPSHPAMHGTIRMIVDVDGEAIRNVDVQIGFLHRGFEKMCERGTWNQVFPYTDRLNYVSPMICNIGFAMTVEKLAGITVPERCLWYRTLLSEVSRLSDHLTCNGAVAMELGAFTPFLWMMKARDHVYDFLEEETGARVTHSFARIGGMAKPPNAEMKQRLEEIIPAVEDILDEVEKILFKNRIFLDRLQGVGAITQAEALQYGWTGPTLRSTGVAYDVRRAHPYLKYGELDFDIPVGTDGDNYDRFMVRHEEMKQAIRIIRQCMQRMPDEGPIDADAPGIVLPPKQQVYTTIEGTIQHFKVIMEGAKIPAGEVYGYVEGGNGEFGFFVVSDGTGTPYRVRCRPPCVFTLQAFPRMIRGHMIADIVPTFGSVNMIGGECDR
ncbi:MAG: NADH-quinone oxidoreductase subunit D [Deltaproteobacteria bacterium]|nr:NADH-quinone oxidoreductase subunit D [Deltaproteobacteria bacterium]